MEGLPPVDFRGELNDEQYAAVTSPRGPALVLAGAGSGKTRTLTYRVAWLLHQGAKPWDILLLTFTNKSAKEMLERVEDLTGVPRGQFWGGTFHSIGQRILRRNAAVASRSPDFTILDQKESEQLFSEIVKSIDGAFIKDKTNPKASVILDAYSHARNTLRPVAEVSTTVRPIPPRISPLANFGNHRRFCSSVPCRWTQAAMIRCELKMPTGAIQIDAMLITMRAYVEAERPSPPYSGSIVAPKRPSSFICSTISSGYSSAWSNFLAMGFSSRSAQRSIDSRISLSTSLMAFSAVTVRKNQ